jgi:hypothetical protein
MSIRRTSSARWLLVTLGVLTLAFATLCIALYVLPANQVADSECSPTHSVGSNYRIWGVAAALVLA